LRKIKPTTTAKSSSQLGEEMVMELGLELELEDTQNRLWTRFTTTMSQDSTFKMLDGFNFFKSFIFHVLILTSDTMRIDIINGSLE